MNVDISGPAIRDLSRRAIADFVQSCTTRIRRKGYERVRASEVSIAFVDDATMKRLNSTWRGKRGTTDVLTFPASGDEGSLGEIIISVDQAKRQARDERHSLATEIRYLLLHGLLHAHGYDHEADDGTMNRIELELRAPLGLA